MAEKYLLVNPIIIGGNSQLSFDGYTPNEAAQNAWDNISKNIVNLLPKSYFSLQNENNKLFHFEVKEKMTNSKQKGGGTLKYSISQFDLDLPKNIQRLFLEKVKNVMDQRNIINSINDNINNDDGISSEIPPGFDNDKYGGSSNDNSDSSNKYKKHSYKGKYSNKKKHKFDDEDEDEDSDSDDVNDKYLIKLYKKWKQERFLSYIEPAVFYWWYTPTIYKLSSLYTPIPNTILYYNDVTPYYKQVILPS